MRITEIIINIEYTYRVTDMIKLKETLDNAKKYIKEIMDNAKKYTQLCKLLYADTRTPKIAKILLWIAIIYALSPIDLIPDFIPVIGYLDDIVIIPALLYLAIKSMPKEVYTENYNQIFKKNEANLLL